VIVASVSYSLSYPGGICFDKINDESGYYFATQHILPLFYMLFTF
jgi:hypothetical protein